MPGAGTIADHMKAQIAANREVGNKIAPQAVVADILMQHDIGDLETDDPVLTYKLDDASKNRLLVNTRIEATSARLYAVEAMGAAKGARMFAMLAVALLVVVIALLLLR